MKIVKYLLVAAFLLGLYITEPLWRVRSTCNTEELSQIDQEYQAYEEKRKTLVTSEAKKIIKCEEDIGKRPSVAYKSRVPKPLQAYWNQTLKKGDSVFEEICTRLEASDKGWTTTCQYKIRHKDGSSSTLKFDTFTIKHGKIIQ